MMTMLVASFGLLPGGAIARHRLRFAAPVRHRDRRRAGSRADPRESYLLPTLYVWVAGERDVLPEVEEEAE